MALNVGELIAYLRLDMRTFEDGMARAQTLSDKLDGKDVDVKVNADTAAAEAKLAGVAASEDKVDEGNKKIAASGHQAGQGMGAVVAAAVLLGPALVPVAAGAAGLAVGFGAMGSAGVLALVGIRQQMTAGTATGEAYTSMLASLKGDLSSLGQTAATGVLGPFQSAVADLQTRMPALNGQIGELSTVTGKTAGAITGGLVAAFLALAPLEREAGVYIYDLSTRFAGLMSGPGVVAFGDYARSVFPQVMQAVESIAGAAFHLVAAIAPLGMGSLGILRMLSDLINGIPVDVLASLAQLASSVYVGFQAFKLLSAPLSGLSAALVGVGVSAEVAATGVRTLTIAAGVIGAVLGVATLLYSAFAESQRKSTQAANDFADAIRQDNGALGENTRAMAAKKLQDSGLLATAQQMHIPLSLLTDDILGQSGAHEKLTAAIDAYVAATPAQMRATGAVGEVHNQVASDAAEYLDKVQAITRQVNDGAAAEKALADATSATTATLDPAAAAQDVLAAKIGTTSAALVLATAGQETTTKAGLSESTGKARAQMEQMRQQIIDNATAHGVDKDAVTAYVDGLLKIPETVPPTKLDVDTSGADTKVSAYVQSLLHIPMAISTTVTATMVGNLASTYASQVPHHAAGGLLAVSGLGSRAARAWRTSGGGNPVRAASCRNNHHQGEVTTWHHPWAA